MRVIHLAIKDWMQIFRDWKSGLFLVAMPILFTLFFGMVMGSALNPSGEEDSRLPVGVLNGDQSGQLGSQIVALLGKSGAVRPVKSGGMSRQEMAKQVEDGSWVAAVLLPKGFSRGMFDEWPVQVEVIADPATPAGETALTAVETTINRLQGAVKSAHLSADAYETAEGFKSEAEREVYLMAGLGLAMDLWEEPPLGTTMEMATGEAQVTDTSGNLDGFAQASSGMMVQFAIFGLITSAMVLVMERKHLTLGRLLTTPMTRAEVIAGHLLAMFVIVFLQQVLLVGFGQTVFGLNYLREPAALLIMMVALALWSACLGLLISVLAKGEEQVVTLSMIAMFLFASLGGAWFPLEVAGKTFAAVGHLMPTAWAMDGFHNILLRGLGVDSVLIPAGMLGLFALIFFAIAVWRFRINYR